MAYLWEDTDHALRAQLAAGAPVGHVRYSDPLTGQDVMPTMRCEILRVPAGFITGPARQTGGRIGCVPHGSGELHLDIKRHSFGAPGSIYSAAFGIARTDRSARRSRLSDVVPVSLSRRSD
jgi:gentisate 1,2-dioxygenase